MVEADGIGAEVPLANHGGAVTGFLEEDGEGLLVAVELGAVVEEAVEVGMFASEDAGSGGAADGVGAKAVFEEEAVLGDAIDGRGGCDFVEDAAGIGRDGLAGVVVGKEEKNVGALGRDKGAGGERESEERADERSHSRRLRKRREKVLAGFWRDERSRVD